MSTPALSTIETDGARVGYRAASMLATMLEGGPTPSEPMLVAPRGVVERGSTDSFAVEDPVVKTAVRFIRERACGGIDAEDVAGAVHRSRRGLELRFSKALGLSPATLILRAQLRRAAVADRDRRADDCDRRRVRLPGSSAA